MERLVWLTPQIRLLPGDQPAAAMQFGIGDPDRSGNRDRSVASSLNPPAGRKLDVGFVRPISAALVVTYRLSLPGLFRVNGILMGPRQPGL
jgi:hypothetical protein